MRAHKRAVAERVKAGGRGPREDYTINAHRAV